MRQIPPAIAGLVLLAVSACTTAPPPSLPSFNVSRFRTFLVPGPLLPIHMEGGVQISYRGELESGDLSLDGMEGPDGPAYILRLHTRLTGTLALEIRIDGRLLLVLDYVNETYFQGDNTEENRLGLFEMDLKPTELQILLTGRVLESRFRAGNGTFSSGGKLALYSEGEFRHRFRLDAHGLPEEWLKQRDGVDIFRVEFREYLELPQADGPPLRLPRKVRLYQGQDQARLVFGIRSVAPGRSAPPFPREILPPGAAHFSPSLLGGDSPPSR